MINYDPARVEQEGLGKTNLPFSFWTAAQWGHICQNWKKKVFKKKPIFFFCKVYICTAFNGIWASNPLFFLSLCKIFSSTFSAVFFLFFLYVFFNILKQMGLDLTWGCGCSCCLWSPTHPFLSPPQKSKLESIKWKIAQHRPWSVSIWVWIKLVQSHRCSCRLLVVSATFSLLLWDHWVKAFYRIQFRSEISLISNHFKNIIPNIFFKMEGKSQQTGL